VELKAIRRTESKMKHVRSQIKNDDASFTYYLSASLAILDDRVVIFQELIVEFYTSKWHKIFFNCKKNIPSTTYFP
jgi:hypothetical protein